MNQFAILFGERFMRSRLNGPFDYSTASPTKIRIGSHSAALATETCRPGSCLCQPLCWVRVKRSLPSILNLSAGIGFLDSPVCPTREIDYIVAPTVNINTFRENSTFASSDFLRWCVTSAPTRNHEFRL